MGKFNTFISTYPDAASAFFDKSNRVHSKMQTCTHNPHVTHKTINHELYHNKNNVLYIFPNLTLDQPITLSTVFSQYRDTHTLIIIVDRNTSVSIHDMVADAPIARHIQYWVHENAHLRLFYVQNGLSSTHNQTIACYADTYSTINIQSLIAGELLSKTFLSLYMYGMHAQAHISGAIILKDTHNNSVSLYQKHLAPRTTSHAAIRGIIRNNAQLSYNGLIVIDSEATNSEATQENKNILLDSGARAESIPSLEILTNEVQCAHGSAVSYLDPEQLFYAQSRGLDPDISRRILIESFAYELFEKNAYSPPCSPLLEHLQALLS